MTAPLTKVGTMVASINLDISRKLNWGKGLTLEFITVDRNEITGWKTWATRTKGFDRVTADEKTHGDGSDVILEVADPAGSLAAVLRERDLHVRVDSTIYKVGTVPPLPPNVAQVYTLTCKVRTVRTNFDTTNG